MQLIRLTYASTANGLDEETIEDILAVANKHNASKQITGILSFSRKFFLQCIEGPRTNVNILYNKICQDKRHSKILLLDYQEIGYRHFSEWSMKYFPHVKLTKAMCLKYSTGDEFNPYLLSQLNASCFIKELADMSNYNHDQEAA